MPKYLMGKMYLFTRFGHSGSRIDLDILALTFVMFNEKHKCNVLYPKLCFLHPNDWFK